MSRELASTQLRDSPIGPVAFDRRGEPRSDAIAFARAERRESIPAVYNDVTGGVLERVITPPARLIVGAG